MNQGLSGEYVSPWHIASTFAVVAAEPHRMFLWEPPSTPLRKVLFWSAHTRVQATYYRRGISQSQIMISKYVIKYCQEQQQILRGGVCLLVFFIKENRNDRELKT